jgi:hypothetical protein
VQRWLARRRALRWTLEALVVEHPTVARIAEGSAVVRNTADDAVLVEGQRVSIATRSALTGSR